MATVAPSGNGAAPSVPNNDGGTVVHGGTLSATSPLTKNVTLRSLADDFGTSTGSEVLEKDGTGAATTDRAGVRKAVSAGTFAYEAPNNKWVMRGGNVTTTLAGTANTVLRSGGSDYNNASESSIHAINSTRVLGSGGGTIDLYARPSTDISPAYTKGDGAGNLQNYVRPSGNGLQAATDEAAAPTRAIPGELTYRFGGPLPKQADYKAKDTRET